MAETDCRESVKMRVCPKYDIIYADPPWQYEFHQSSKLNNIENHYLTMPLNDIKKLPIPAKKNSVCFLWVTVPKLKEGLEVLEAWGFRYRSGFVWDKIIWGTGYWSRVQHELLLIGTKGKFSPPIPEYRVSSVFREKRTKHSQKPIKIRILISKWYPEKTKLEMFARDHVEGWDVWGNEIPNSMQKELSLKINKTQSHLLECQQK